MTTFTIPGVPVAKGRAKFARRGAFITAYTPEKTVNYENLVKMMAAQAMGDTKPLECAVSACIALRIIPPSSWSLKKRQRAIDGEMYPTSKPDIDNVVKAIFDAMNGIVFLDDKQVCNLNVEKRYCLTACAVVTIRELRREPD